MQHTCYSDTAPAVTVACCLLLLLCVQELFQLNVFKGATSALRSANPIGWASLQLRDICSSPFERHEVELRCA